MKLLSPLLTVFLQVFSRLCWKCIRWTGDNIQKMEIPRGTTLVICQLWFANLPSTLKYDPVNIHSFRILKLRRHYPKGFMFHQLYLKIHLDFSFINSHHYISECCPNRHLNSPQVSIWIINHSITQFCSHFVLPLYDSLYFISVLFFQHGENSPESGHRWPRFIFPLKFNKRLARWRSHPGGKGPASLLAVESWGELSRDCYYGFIFPGESESVVYLESRPRSTRVEIGDGI